MIVLKIIGIVLAIIILLIALLLLCPVGIEIKTDREQDVQLFVRALFLKIPIPLNEEEKPEKKKSEKKPSKPKKEPEKKQGFVQTILDALGISKFTSIKKDTEKQGFAETISDIIGVVTNIIKQIVTLFKHIKIKKLHINCICGGEDAAETAMDYGVACAVIYPLSGYLHSIAKIRERKKLINVQCDFNREESQFDFDIHLSTRVLFIATAFIGLIKKESQRKLQEME